MKTKLAIIDKDGTIVQPKSGETFVQAPTDQELIPGAKEAIAFLSTNGYSLAIASNQGGVAAKHKSLEDAAQEMRYCMGLTGINAAYFCPDFEGQTCYRITFSDGEFTDPERLTPADFANSGEKITNFRKPEAGMLQVASLFRQLELANPEDTVEAIFVGDRDEDCQAAVAAGIPFTHAEAWRSGSVVYL